MIAFVSCGVAQKNTSSRAWGVFFRGGGGIGIVKKTEDSKCTIWWCMTKKELIRDGEGFVIVRENVDE